MMAAALLLVFATLAAAAATNETMTPTPVPTMTPTTEQHRVSSNNLVNTAVEWAEIASTLQVNGLLFVVFLVLFEWKRAKWSRVYSPRSLYYKSLGREISGAKVPERKEPSRWFGWLTFATSVPDDDMRRMVGLDAFLLLRFCRGFKRLFFWASFFGLVVLLPIYSTGLRNKTGFYRLTMGNLKKGQPRLWAPVVFQYCLTFLVLRLLEQEARNYLKWRRDYFSFFGAAEADEYQSRCSVMVERLPAVLRSDDSLRCFFQRLVGKENVYSANVFLDLRDLERKLRLRDNAVNALKRVVLSGRKELTVVKALYRQEIRLRPFRIRRNCCTVTVDAPDYFAAKLEFLDKSFVDSRNRALADERISDNNARRGGFLSFGLARTDAPAKADFFFDHSPFEWIARVVYRSSDDSRRPLLSEEKEAAADETTNESNGGSDGGGSNHSFDLEKKVDNSSGTKQTAANAATMTTTPQDERPSLDHSNSAVRQFLEGSRDAAQTLLRQAGDLTESTIGGLATTLAIEEMLLNAQFYQRASTGVVTFTNPGTASDVAQLALTSEPRGIEAKAVPTPGNILWQNVGVSQDAYEARTIVADCFYWSVALLWSFLITLIQAVANLDELATVFPFIKPFVREERYEYPRSLVTGYLPVILYLTLLAIVPIFIERIGKDYVGLQSKTAVQRYVLSRHFYFQLVSLIVTCLSGSLTKTLKDFLKSPSTILQVLGKNIPTISAYFMQTLCVKALFSLSFEIGRPLQYLVSSASGKITKYIIRRRQNNTVNVVDGGSGRKAATKKQHEDSEDDDSSYGSAASSVPTEVDIDDVPVHPATDIKPPAPPEFRIGYTGPEFLMVVLVGLTYAPIAPAILVVACVFFAFAEAVFARQFLFVYTNISESGGIDVFPALSFFTTLSLLVAQAVLLCYLFLLNGLSQAPALLPLPFLTVYFYMWLVRFYEEPANFLDRDTAITHDLYRPNPATPLRPAAYRQPALVADSVSAAAVRAHLTDIVDSNTIQSGSTGLVVDSPCSSSTPPLVVGGDNNETAPSTTANPIVVVRSGNDDDDDEKTVD